MSMTSMLEAAPLDEAAVLRRVRCGDRHAYGMLYERHLAGARRVAGSLLRDPADVDDVVAEAFASAFAAMRRGRGPVDVFGPYIHSCVRNECRRSWSRERGRIRTKGDDAVVEAHSVRRDGRDDEFGHLEESDVVRAALDAMPPRLRAVLWYTEVDDLSHATIARMTGSTPQAVAALAMRARRAFADRYLQAHLAADDGELPTTDCHKVRSGLAEVVRGTASARRCRATSEHLAACTACAAAQDNLTVVNERLRTVPLFALVTGRGAAMLHYGAKARFLSWIAGPAVELTAAGGLALVVALAPAATAPTANAAPPSVEQAAAGLSAVPIDLLAPVVIEPDVDAAAATATAGQARGAIGDVAEVAIATGIAAAAGAPTATPARSPSGASPQLTEPGTDPVTSSTPGTMTPGAIAAAAIGGTAVQPIIDALPSPSAILDGVVGGVLQAVIGGAVLPAVPLPPVPLPEVTAVVDLTGGAAAVAAEVDVPLPPLPPALEAAAPLVIEAPGASATAGVSRGNGGSTGAGAGVVIGSGGSGSGSGSGGGGSGSGSVGAGVGVNVGSGAGGSGGGGGGTPGGVEVEIDVDVPIVGDAELDVGPISGGLLPGG